MFRRGLILGRVRGVPIRAHWTLLLVLPYLAIVFASRFTVAARLSGVDPADTVIPPLAWGALVAVGLFASVAVHELAHTLIALRAGGRVREITLMMLGGVSQVERMPRRPRTEAIMAAAGPATSLLLGVALLGTLFLPLPADARLGCFYLAQLNLVLGIFNLLPAFPMDGGRVLRGALASRMGSLRATRIAAVVGKASAVGLALWGLWEANFLLMLIALFVFTGAEVERVAEERRDALARLRVADVMSTSPPVVHADDSLDQVLGHMRTAGRLDMVVVGDRGEPMGVVRASDMAGVAPTERARLRVVDLGPRLASRGMVVSPGDSVMEALDRAARMGAEYLLATDGETLAGVVGPHEVENAMILSSLETPRPAPTPRHEPDMWPRGA